MINTQQLYRQVKNIWNTLYPVYFNKDRSLAEGRRVSLDLATSQPTIEEISRAVGLCRVKNILEPYKAYPRNILERGRLKVQVFDQNNKPIHAHMPTKGAFMREVALKLKQVRESGVLKHHPPHPNKK